MSVAEALLHYFVDVDAEILGRGHLFFEFGQRVQVLVAEAFQDFGVHEAVEID
jgi:hypothetical protein